MRRKAILLVEFLILAIILVSGHVSPTINLAFSFLSFLIFPAMGILLILAFIYRLRKSKKAYYYLIFFIVFFLMYGSRIFQLSFHTSHDSSLKVLSYNVGRFKQGVNPNELDNQLNEFFKFLKDAQVDVICFQEFSFVTRNLNEDLSNLGYQPVMFKNLIKNHQNIRENYFVRHEYLDTRVVANEESEDQGVTMKILFENDTIQFLNTHVKSYNIKGQHPFRQESLKGSIEAAKVIFSNIGQYVNDQIAQITMLIEASEGVDKVIFCGDFNSLPSSYIYSTVKKDFNSSFEDEGQGFGFTYLGKTLFFLRIDNQFYKSKSMECIRLEEFNFGFSDHRALLGEYVVKK